VLPLAVSTFKLNTRSPTWRPALLAQLYGVSLTPGQIADDDAVAVAMSFSNPGSRAAACSSVTAPVMLVAGPPARGDRPAHRADAIPDVFNTLVNVTGDMTVAAASRPRAALADGAGAAAAGA
jgi:Na+/H+-dicarboxylate symporter